MVLSLLSDRSQEVTGKKELMLLRLFGDRWISFRNESELVSFKCAYLVWL
jgi:hypothetical protein